MWSLKWGQGLGLGLLAWCVGVALQLQQEALWPMLGYATGCVLTGCAGWRWCGSRVSGHWRRLALCLFWGSAAFHATGLHALLRSHSIDPALEGRDLDVVGVVQAMPQRQDVGWRFRFQIEQAWQTDQTGQAQVLDLPQVLPSQVYLGWYGQDGTDDSGWSTSALPEPVKAGERWRLRVRLKAPHGNLNPRGFDYELWLWEQGIRATGYVRVGPKDPAPVRLASTWAHPIEGWRQSVRDRLLAHVSQTTWTGLGSVQSEQLAGVVAALVTGDQAAIDRADWDVFRATGVAHLMIISGLHVTMFAWLASILVAWCWRKSALWGFAGPLHWPASHVGAVAGLVLAGFYALFSGWGVPAQRTLWMLGVVVLLKMSSRQWPGALIWLLAGAVVLTLDPWALLQPGFWLSFVAVGVLMASDQHGARDRAPTPESAAVDDLQHRTESVPKSAKHRWGAQEYPIWGAALWHQVGHLWREQAAITWALAPLTLLFFGQVSWVGLLANLLAIPWVTLVVTPLAMLGVVWSDAWALSAWALQPMVSFLSWLAAWPLSSLSTAMPPWPLAMLALLGAMGMVLRLPLSWKLLCLPLLWPVLFWVHPRPAMPAFELLAADVGQGNAVLVRTAHHSLLYDAGPRYSAESDAGHRVLVPLLTQMGERLDVLMLSHRDTDHTGGAAAVLAMQPQAHLWSSLEDDHPLHALRAGWTRCQSGQSWVWDGVLFEVLHPPAAQQAAMAELPPKRLAPNAVSCVLRIDNGQASVLLTGDIEAAQELLLLQAGLSPIDLLLVPHHGSKTSSSRPFLQALKPRLALVQAGYRNRFGHPARPVTERYRAEGIGLVESTRCGAATWDSERPAQVACERVRSQRYWRHDMGP